ncbi:peptidase [Paenibacillus arenilitoris]|uniref:Peptidase n=1 Tax=Paenibacillus arenilitoris TaxID=2772299 RepID=A0A927H689_9BACL|nr:peptidase [Paenibacillus arenilitoris]MBD2869252.1 peptidase [Paenibacillus arenilitoris]
MKKMYKVLTTASILAMAALPIVANAQGVPVQGGQAVIQNQVKIVPGTMGQITDFVKDESGTTIKVTGRGLEATDQSEMILSVTPESKIIDTKGNPVDLQTIVDEKKTIKAFYSPNLTKSMPARGTLLTLIVRDQALNAVEGAVSEVTDNGIVVEGKDIYTSIEETIVLHFADKAQILDQNGKAVQAADIKPGMSVRAFYGPAVTMSLPPQATTNYVVVNTGDETAPEAAPGTNGIITDAADNTITVIGNPLEQGGVNYVILTVDENTEIVGEDGSSLTPDALKADTRVEAYYGEVMTMIYPAQTHADKIVVKKEETNKIEGTIIESDRTTEDQVYVDVDSDQAAGNDVILTISDKTQVIPALGGDEELQPGMKIVAYHSSIMTKSLPGITEAEIVIVAADDTAEPSE